MLSLLKPSIDRNLKPSTKTNFMESTRKCSNVLKVPGKSLKDISFCK